MGTDRTGQRRFHFRPFFLMLQCIGQEAPGLLMQRVDLGRPAEVLRRLLPLLQGKMTISRIHPGVGILRIGGNRLLVLRQGTGIILFRE